MSALETEQIQVPDDRPPGWANSLMRWALTTPGIQSWVGQGVALLTFTGRRSGKRYTIPVSYQRSDDVVTVVTKRVRKWWHNFETPAEAELRIAGHTYAGKAELIQSEAEVSDFMVDYLAKRPIDAKAYGLKSDQITREKIAGIVPHIVVIQIHISPQT
jgi:deazaflavin-dependent oxidoreductase (nitroreductase family)